MEATIYNQIGKVNGKIELESSIFGVIWNPDLVHQVMTSLYANARANIAKAKDRSEVRGGGKKPWRQKGTGRARHGSSRSPIWVGGGVTHGPVSGINYSKKINKKMKTKALFTLLSKKLADGEVIFVEDLNLETGKTKLAKTFLANLAEAGFKEASYDKGRRIFMTTPTLNKTIVNSFNNLKTVKIEEARNLNLLDVLTYKYLVIMSPKETCEQLIAKIN